MTIPPQVRRIGDNQGDMSNCPIMPIEVIVTINGDDTHHLHDYYRKSTQYKASRGRVFPYKHQNRHRHKQRLWKVKNISSQHDLKISFRPSSLQKQISNKTTGVYATPRAEKRLQNIIELHKTCENLNIIPHQVSNLGNSNQNTYNLRHVKGKTIK